MGHKILILSFCPCDIFFSAAAAVNLTFLLNMSWLRTKLKSKQGGEGINKP